MSERPCVVVTIPLAPHAHLSPNARVHWAERAEQVAMARAAALGAIDPPAWSGPRRLRQGNGRGKEDPVVEAALLLRKRLASAALAGEGAAEIERLLGAIRALEQARG